MRMIKKKNNTMRLKGMTIIEDKKKALWKCTVTTQDNNYYIRKVYVILKYAIYQSGLVDLPPGG
jgi:hypothetical protein